MNFISVQYIVFLPLIVCVYFLMPHRYRWILLLAASYFFYGVWYPAYLLILIASTVLDYVLARFMDSASSNRGRSLLLFVSLACNLGLLFFFKYWNFFSETADAVLNAAHMPNEFSLHKILLPIGISFYTFQSLSYMIDVYHRKIPAEKHLGYYAVYVAFFPQLVAGPIERAGHMLPQYKQPVVFSETMFVRGLRWILWGFFLKIVIADNLALYVNSIYGNVHVFHGLPLLIATYFFAFQIYCDFAGYSAIALGSASLLGIDLIENFKRPYLAASVTDFWRRWHIALSSWFRDYVYIPLGGNRGSFSRQLLNIFLTFLLSGLWHGANWTYVAWGCLHGLYLIIERIVKKLFPAFDSSTGFVRYAKIFLTFHLVCFAWIFFRAASLQDAFFVVSQILHSPLQGGILTHVTMSSPIFGLCVLLIICLSVVSLCIERIGNISVVFEKLPVFFRWSAYYALIFAIVFLAANHSATFIYFQF